MSPLARKSYEPDARGPLAGVRVLDLSRLVSGNTLTMMLADYGADVVKVETPDGDTLRAWRVAGVQTYWAQLARNKRSLCVNLRDPRGLELLRGLVGGAKMLVESFRPGTLEAMGLGPEALHALNPRLVVVRISGWGQSGPYRERPGFGTLIEGMSGFASMNGFADREPVLPPNALADSVAAFAGAAAAMVALREVEVNGGKGQVIDLPLFDPLFSILGPQAANYRLTGQVKQRTGSRSTNAAPRNVYRTRDGNWVSLSASTQGMTERLFRAIGRAELIDDPRYRSNAERVQNAAELDAIIGAFIGARTLAETMAFFSRAEVTIAPVYDIAQILEDEHLRAREVVVELPDRRHGWLPMNAIVPRLEATPGRYFRPAPALGQHNRELLAELGIDDATRAGLERDGVVAGEDGEANRTREA